MKVFRIGRSKYAGDLSGEGAKLFGGRWNHKSVPCIYTSESRALALLEYTVNINIDDIPRALTITTFEFSLSEIKIVERADLPGDWQDAPAPSSTKDFGTAFLRNLTHAVLKIPSSVMADEFNYLLNPLHRESKHVKILEIKDFVYDVRIKMNLGA